MSKVRINNEKSGENYFFSCSARRSAQTNHFSGPEGWLNFLRICLGRKGATTTTSRYRPYRFYFVLAFCSLLFFSSERFFPKQNTSSFERHTHTRAHTNIHTPTYIQRKYTHFRTHTIETFSILVINGVEQTRNNEQTRNKSIDGIIFILRLPNASDTKLDTLTNSQRETEREAQRKKRANQNEKKLIHSKFMRGNSSSSSGGSIVAKWNIWQNMHVHRMKCWQSTVSRFVSLCVCVL